MEPCVLAIDLGASSGRVIAALSDGKTLRCHEIHRFANEPVACCGSLYWDVLSLFNQIKKGIALAAQGWKDDDSLAASRSTFHDHRRADRSLNRSDAVLVFPQRASARFHHSVNPAYLFKAGRPLMLLILTALLCRMAAVAVCLIKTPLTRKERLFCMIAYSPKATVQAAIGAVPLSLGLACGELV